jgi:dihydrolipoamide dehydrogenase
VTDVRVPDIGDFTDVPVIEIHVAPGDAVAAEDPLVTLESDKATMDIPAPAAGTVGQLRVAIGDRVSEGNVLLTLDTNGAGPSGAQPEDESSTAAATQVVSEPPPSDGDGAEEHDAQVVVLGAGPGGYTAAFRAADLGLRTVLVERHERLGGVCLNVGCIPSKALLHAARVVAEAEEMGARGISFSAPSVDVERLIGWKEEVVGQLTGGLSTLAKQRDVEVVRGEGSFSGPHALTVGEREITFEHCIVAAGSSAALIPGLPEDPRIVDSTGALSPASVPGRLLVIGGGIIGLELATVYDALGSRITVVEMLEQLMTGCDPDLVRPLQKRISGRYEAIHLGARVAGVKARKDGLEVEIEGVGRERFDQILVAVGRVPNGRSIGAEAAGLTVSERGFIEADQQMRTNVPHIYAIGDIVGGPMLAHKASHEGKVAAEVIAGQDVAFDAAAIPSVAYTDPEVAWMGLTETVAEAEEIQYEKAVFPWSASGRALALGRSEGFTKLLVEPSSQRVLGCGIVGVSAGDLIAEAVHALEMGADAEDLALTVHPHPTLSETVAFAAEMAAGTITDLIAPRARSPR